MSAENSGSGGHNLAKNERQDWFEEEAERWLHKYRHLRVTAPPPHQDSLDARRRQWQAAVLG